jgi:hypothetical protein
MKRNEMGDEISETQNSASNDKIESETKFWENLND